MVGVLVQVIRRALGAGLLVAGLFFWAAPVGAEGVDDALWSEIARLRELKVQDPTAYRAAIQEKRTRLQGRFTIMEKDPRGFKEVFTDRDRAFRRERFKRLREKDPAAFRRLLASRAERLERLKAKDPQGFQRLKARYSKLAERSQKGQVLEGKPVTEWRAKRLERRKERRIRWQQRGEI